MQQNPSLNDKQPSHELHGPLPFFKLVEFLLSCLLGFCVFLTEINRLAGVSGQMRFPECL